MDESRENLTQESDLLKSAADKLLAYLRDIIYKPRAASLDIESLPEEFGDFGRALVYLGSNISEMRSFARELAVGNLNSPLPPPNNEIVSSLKMLHASLRHLTWQTQQVAKGDYNQRVNFMGDFSTAFNNMIEQLDQSRKNILDEKTKLEMYVHLILVNCANPILLFDSQEKLAYVSDSYFRYFKFYKQEEILGKQIHDLFAPVVPAWSLLEIEHLYKSAIAEKRMVSIEQEISLDKSQPSSHFELQITPMLDTDGSIAGIIMFLFDMTGSIQARQEAERARELAEQASRSKSTFLAKTSHEMRTPMNAILGMAELALRENISPVADEHIRTIRQAGINLLSIINDILDFSKTEAGKLEIVQSEYFFSSLVNDVISIIKTKVFESRLRFVVYLDSNIPNALFGDSIRIRQILINLLGNAVKYTEKGFVAFSVSGEIINEDTVVLTMEVTDSGKGIKQEDMGQLFTEYTRFATADKFVEGTGLGLAITNSLVTAMNGKINVRSDYGKGSTFTVTLPQKIHQSQKLAVVENPGKKNVLIYERREIYANSIVRTMNNLGVNCKLVSTTQEFFNCMISNNYHFVFLASTLYEEVKKKYSELNSNAKFAIIAEFGEAITERNISTLTMPIFSISIANFLNSFSDNYTDNLRRDANTTLAAPEAKVLVVDDINTNLEVVQGLLLPYKIQVTPCKSGIEAIKKIKETAYDLVLMDLMMPEMDGIQAVSHIRAMGDKDPYFKNVPIVALTADAVLGTKETLLKKGFDEFLSKPISTTELDTILEKRIPGEKWKKVIEGSHQNSAANGHSGASPRDKKIEIDGLNAERGIAITGGTEKNYFKILTSFYKDGIEKIKEIRTSLETDNLPLYVIYVHALKSAAATIGADKLSETAKVLETAGNQKNLRFIQAHNPSFLADLEALLSNINTALSERAGKDQKSLTDIELVKAELFRLKTALNAFDSSEIGRAVDALQEFKLPADINDPVSAILKSRLIGEYDEAVIMINTLLQMLNNRVY